jgi:hypothetical protein
MFGYTNMVIASIFNGTLILVPCIWLFFKFYNSAGNKLLLINTINCTLLIGSTFFILYTVATIVIGFSFGTEYDRYATSNRFFGPYWWAFWLEIAPGYLLPQILWFKKLRNTIKSSIVIIIVLYALTLVVKLTPVGWHFYLNDPAIQYLIEAIIYVTILSGIYFLLSKKRISQPTL